MTRRGERPRQTRRADGWYACAERSNRLGNE
jgi:hypothetical protein